MVFFCSLLFASRFLLLLFFSGFAFCSRYLAFLVVFNNFREFLLQTRRVYDILQVLVHLVVFIDNFGEVLLKLRSVHGVLKVSMLGPPGFTGWCPLGCPFAAAAATAAGEAARLAAAAAAAAFRFCRFFAVFL